MPERMRKVEALLTPYVIRCWVESNPQHIKEALYILQDSEVSNRANANGPLTPSYFAMFELHSNQRPRKEEKNAAGLSPSRSAHHVLYKLS